MIKILSCFAISLALIGCASAPNTSSEIAINAGDAPTLAASEAAIKGYLSDTLKDPDSLKQFSIVSGPTYMTWYRGLLFGGGHDAAWLVCYEYNAKNSYGGYVGVKRDGNALRRTNDGAQVVPLVNWGMASRRC